MNAAPKPTHPVLTLPERFRNLSVQFGTEPQLTQIKSGRQAGQETIPPNGQPHTETLSLPVDRQAVNQPQEPDEPPFRLYDLVKLEPETFWKVYNARAYDDLLLRLTYERYLPEEKRGKTNWLETVHLTGTSFDPAKSNAIEFWHAVEDGEDDGLIDLKPDPNNTHDPNAIRVLTASHKKQIGWIPTKDRINERVASNYHQTCFNSAQLLKVEPNKNKNGTITSIAIQIAIGWTFPAEVLNKYR
jgi:hypothetical protein